MSRKRIEAIVHGLLTSHKIMRPPVPVERLIRAHGIRTVMKSMDNNVSGFILREGETPIIGVNSYHPSVRQRFTMAHELGHFLLHKENGIHIDEADFLFYRDERSSEGTDVDERDANFFAATLLMPEEFLRKDIAALRNLTVHDDSAMRTLAKKYGVSTQALVFRISSLGLLAFA